MQPRQPPWPRPISYDETYKAAYARAFTNAYDDAFTSAVAKHEGRTEYVKRPGATEDWDAIEVIRKEGADSENVVALKKA
jgi:hypothetical protein